MMGATPPDQNALFYDFCLDQHVPENHLLRKLDRFLDFIDLRTHLEPYYSQTGRPSIDPELMVRMLLIGYCYGIRSERRLCEEVSLNLAYRWFCKLGLEKAIPNHSTFSKNRHGRFRDSEVIRLLFNTVFARCIDEGLVEAEGFAIDASYIRADAARQNFVHSPVDWTLENTERSAVAEYLQLLDEHSELNRGQNSVSKSNSMCQWSGAKGSANFFYSTNYMIDVSKNIIVDVEATPSTIALEVRATKTMLDRIADTHKLKPRKLMADTAYGAAFNLGYLVDEVGVEPHIPVRSQLRDREGIFSVSDFDWNSEADEYTCPGQKRLKSRQRLLHTGQSTVTKADTIIYRSRQADCRDCPLKEQCCPNTSFRKITRSIHEAARDVARHITASDEYENISRNERKKVEVLFAHIKTHLNFNRLRLRGLKSANDEFLMVDTVQNLKKMAQLCV